MALTAIVTLTADSATLAGVRDLVTNADTFGIDETTELLDGGHIRIGDEPPLMDTYPPTLGGLRAWADAHASNPGDCVVEYANDLSIDLDVHAVNPISCGEHLGAMPDNVVVTVHPACRHHD